MPTLPDEEPIFTVNKLLSPSAGNQGNAGETWQWREDGGSWKCYSKADSRYVFGITTCTAMPSNAVVERKRKTFAEKNIKENASSKLIQKQYAASMRHRKKNYPQIKTEKRNFKIMMLPVYSDTHCQIHTCFYTLTDSHEQVYHTA